jgi:hypothetical protein
LNFAAFHARAGIFEVADEVGHLTILRQRIDLDGD